MTLDQARNYRDRSPAFYDAISDGARGATAAVLKEYQADNALRFARTSRFVYSPTPALPPHIGRPLKAILQQIMRPGECLWLELADPVGFLPIVPWEHLLRPNVDAPIVRVSRHAIRPLRPSQDLTVVLGWSVPSQEYVPTADWLSAFVVATCRSLPPGSNVHIFANDPSHARFAEALALLSGKEGAPERLTLHPLPPATDLDADKSKAIEGQTTPNDIREHPWMTWMTRSLGNHAVDIMSWVSPATILADGARLIITRTPQNPGDKLKSKSWMFWNTLMGLRALRYASAQTLGAVSTELGAWGLILSAPPRDREAGQSRAALRLLADDVSRSQPGMVALHDMAADPKSIAFAELLSHIAGTSSKQPMTESVLLYDQMESAATAIEEKSTGRKALMTAYAATRAAASTILERPGPAPLWVAATQRAMEGVVSRYLTRPGVSSAGRSPLDDAAEEGVAEALGIVERLFNKRSDVIESPTSETTYGA